MSRNSQADQGTMPQLRCMAAMAPGSNRMEAVSSTMPPRKLAMAAICAGASVRISGRASTEPRQ